jgi:hypothetical protein
MVDSIALAAEERLSRLFDHVWLDPNAHSYQQLEAIRFLPTRPAAGVAWNDR